MGRFAASIPQALVVALLASACGGPPAARDGRVRIELPAASLTAAGVARILVTVWSGAGPAFAPFYFELSNSGSSWTSTLNGLPAGPQRQFDFHGLDSTGTQVLTASIRCDVPSNGAIVISAVLQPGPTPSTVSYLPVIDALSASAPSTPPGGSISLSASAHAVDPTDTLSYAWQATCGLLSRTDVLQILWTAPSTSGSVCTLSLKVSGRAGSVSLSIPLSVQ